VRVEGLFIFCGTPKPIPIVVIERAAMGFGARSSGIVNGEKKSTVEPCDPRNRRSLSPLKGPLRGAGQERC